MFVFIHYLFIIFCFSFLRMFESHKIWVSGLVVGEICDTPSHWQQKMDLSDWFVQNNIPGICDIDTRQLTKHIREKGSMLGRIISGTGNGIPRFTFTDPNLRNLVAEVSTKVSFLRFTFNLLKISITASNYV